MEWKDAEVLITGGTGSLGKALVSKLHDKVRGIRIFSRDELKQWEMRKWLKKNGGHAKISFLIGDVRNRERLSMAMQGVHYVIHTAAMKQVPTCEYNPWEAVYTNVIGAWNVIHAALLNRSVRKVMNISTDKAVYPINLYGHTKATAEKLFIHSNIYSRGGLYPYFSCCRYGNVIGSRGSILPLFLEQAEANHKITITHPDMTRFWISLNSVANFVISRIDEMTGGEIFIPEMPSIKIKDIAEVIAGYYKSAHTTPDIEIEETGIRPGEKIHECIITEEERSFLSGDANMNYFIIKKGFEAPAGHKGKAFYSNDNEFLSKKGIAQIIHDYKEWGGKY